MAATMKEPCPHKPPGIVKCALDGDDWSVDAKGFCLGCRKTCEELGIKKKDIPQTNNPPKVTKKAPAMASEEHVPDDNKKEPEPSMTKKKKTK